MTIRFTLTLAVEGATTDSGATTHTLSAVVERGSLTAGALGLTLAEGKAILAELQVAIVAEQFAAHGAAARVARRAGRIGVSRAIARLLAAPSSARSLSRPCGCGAANVVLTKPRAIAPRSAHSPTFCPSAQCRSCSTWKRAGSPMVSYGLAARMLGDVLPMDRPVSPERVRRHLQAVATGEEAATGQEPSGADWAWSGCQRDLDDMPPPDGPTYVGVDGGFVRDRAGSWFEVVAGKVVPGFRRDAPQDKPPRSAKCFAFVQAHDDRPRRRLLDVLAAQAMRRTRSSCSCRTAARACAGSWCGSAPRPSTCWTGFTSPCA